MKALIYTRVIFAGCKYEEIIILEAWACVSLAFEGFE